MATRRDSQETKQEDASAQAELWVKVCGVLSVEQASMVVDAGVDAIGLNFVPTSKRRIAVETADTIVRALGGAVEWVGVFANQAEHEVRAIAEELGLDRIQLHGDEPPEFLRPWGSRVYKALRIASAEDLAREGHYSGDRLLLDSKVFGALGGTGHCFEWALAREVAGRRRLVVAGGITEENVADAVAQLRPFGVDTASGVESSPGVKDRARTRRFVENARRAHRQLT